MDYMALYLLLYCKKCNLFVFYVQIILKVEFYVDTYTIICYVQSTEKKK